MNTFQRNVALRVLGIHVAVILFLFLVAGLKGCFRPKPKPEIVTFIDFGQPGPPVQVQEVAEQPEPPRPEPPKEIPKPREVPKPKPKDTPKPKPKPKPPEPEKPKWKPVSPDKIKVGPKVDAPKPVQPAVSPSDIQKALSGISEPTGPVGNPDQIAAYDSHIHTVFYNAWNRPAVPGLRPAKVTISISSTGRVLSSDLNQSSGDTAFDTTVMNAVRSVKILPKKPPAGYPLNNIIVQFRLIE